MADLLATTGLSASSFYRTFGDKRALYAECLDVFATRTELIVETEQAKGRPLEALKAFFVQTIAGVKTAREQCGCMLVNTVTELAGLDEMLAQTASDHLGSVERMFAKSFRDAGCSRSKADQLAGVLMLVNEGVRVAAKRKASARGRLSSVDVAFDLIEAELAREREARGKKLFARTRAARSSGSDRG